MKSTEVYYHEIFRDFLGKDGITSDQIIKHYFSAKNDVNNNFSININLFN